MSSPFRGIGELAAAVEPEGRMLFLRSRTLQAGFAVALAALAAHALHGALGFGGPGVDAVFNDWVYNALMGFAAAACVARAIVRPGERAAWAAIGAGMVSWVAAEVTYTVLEPEAYPSYSDVLWLLFYPLGYAGLILLVRARAREFAASVWLDGLIAALAAAALGASVLFEAVLSSTGGDAAEVVTNLAYPVADVLTFALVVGVFALCGWRPGLAWTLIGGSFLLNAVADGIYLFQASTGVYVEGTVLDSLWPAAALCLALAAWGPSTRGRVTLAGRGMLVVPLLFGALAVALLAYDHFVRLNPLAIALSSATLLAVLLRTALTFRENLGMLDRIRMQAATDALTGIGNRRQLLLDLEDAFAPEGASVLILFDLDGFKGYNDTYGHPAGDALLARLGAKLAAAVASRGACYRLGGDEFCVLGRVRPEEVGALIEAAVEALTEEGEAFSVSSSLGAVFLPEEADTATQALRLADQRLYASKQDGLASRGRQPEDLLLRALYEREPDLHEHAREVAALALAVGERLGLRGHELHELRRAAELHDIGKLAIPDSILGKPGPLTEAEWEFVRRHSSIGARILGASPALAGVARLVRASHENWDGSGYPDGLAAEQIPLGARIVAVCGAYSAMRMRRPHRAPLSDAEAAAEIARSAGGQFDPAASSALLALLREGSRAVIGTSRAPVGA